jgi:hypothetical protein
VGAAALSALIAAGAAPVWAQAMGEVAEVGQKVPADIKLEDTDGKEFCLSAFLEENGKKDPKEQVKAVTLIFWSYTCGVGKKYDKRVKALTETFKGKPVLILGVNSNAPEKAEDTKKYLKQVETELRVLMDPTGEVADLFEAKSVTTTVVIDGKGVLRYWGSIDNDKDTGAEGRKAFVENAINALIEGKDIQDAKTKAFG